MKKRDHEEKFQELYNANQLLGTRLENVKKELMKYQAENTMLLEKSTELEKNAASSRDTIQSLKDHIDTLEDKSFRLDRELSAAAGSSQALASAQEALTAAQAEAQSLSRRCTELEAASAETEALREQNRELSQKCQTQGAEIERLSSALDAAKQTASMPGKTGSSDTAEPEPIPVRQTFGEREQARVHLLFPENERPAAEKPAPPISVEVPDSRSAAAPQYFTFPRAPKPEAAPWSSRQEALADPDKPLFQEIPAPPNVPAPGAYQPIDKAASMIADAHALAAGIIKEAQNQAQRISEESHHQAETMKNQIMKSLRDMEALLHNWDGGAKK